VQVWQNVIYNVCPADKVYLMFGNAWYKFGRYLHDGYLTQGLFFLS